MQSIKKAIVPAAGLGTRLHSFTKGQPKEMLPIGGRPMIYYALLEAALSGLEEMYIILSDRKPTLRHYLQSENLEKILQKGTGHSIRVPQIICVDQPAPLGSGEAVYRTREMIGEEPFALMMPDFLLFGSPPALTQMIPPFEQFRHDTIGVITLGATEAKGFGNVGIFQPTPLEEGIVEVHEISAKSKEPLLLKEGKTIHKTIGRCILGTHFFSYLESVRSLKGDWDDAPAFRLMCKERKVIGKILEGKAFDVGNPTGYRAANNHVNA